MYEVRSGPYIDRCYNIVSRHATREDAERVAEEYDRRYRPGDFAVIVVEVTAPGEVLRAAADRIESHPEGVRLGYPYDTGLYDPNGLTPLDAIRDADVGVVPDWVPGYLCQLLERGDRTSTVVAKLRDLATELDRNPDE